MVQIIKLTNNEKKKKPYKLTKATWVQTTLYTEKHHQYIKSKPSISYELEPYINHNHSVSNP